LSVATTNVAFDKIVVVIVVVVVVVAATFRSFVRPFVLSLSAAHCQSFSHCGVRAY